MSIINRIRAQAKKDKKTVVLPESGDHRILEAVKLISRESLAEIILIGKEQEIKEVLPLKELDGVRVADFMDFPRQQEYIDHYFELRKHKGITRVQAQEVMSNPIFFAAMLVISGEADGLVGGSICPTADVLRAALQIVNPAPGVNTVSSFMILIVPSHDQNGRILFFADAGVVPEPDAQQLAEIAITTARTFRTLIGETPRVALLSFSSKGSARHRLVDKVVEATMISCQKAPEIIIDGELQADTALVSEVAKRKVKESRIMGDANVLIFPDLNAGNISYKLVQRLAGAQAYGPILQGLTKPVNDLSRGCSIDDIVNVVAITAVESQMNEIPDSRKFESVVEE